MEDSLHERGKAMEDLYFRQSDAKLLKNLRSEMAAKEIRDAFHEVSGFSNPAVLDALVKVGITPASLTSIAFVPLIVVAWADKSMDRGEKAAILQAAEVAGVRPGTASFETLESWLETRPKFELLEAWKAYIAALKPTLDGAAFTQLKHSILGRAEEIASATGGFLGLGNKVSEQEQKVLDELARAFD